MEAWQRLTLGFVYLDPIESKFATPNNSNDDPSLHYDTKRTNVSVPAGRAKSTALFTYVF